MRVDPIALSAALAALTSITPCNSFVPITFLNNKLSVTSTVEKATTTLYGDIHGGRPYHEKSPDHPDSVFNNNNVFLTPMYYDDDDDPPLREVARKNVEPLAEENQNNIDSEYNDNNNQEYEDERYSGFRPEQDFRLRELLAEAEYKAREAKRKAEEAERVYRESFGRSMSPGQEEETTEASYGTNDGDEVNEILYYANPKSKENSRQGDIVTYDSDRAFTKSERANVLYVEPGDRMDVRSDSIFMIEADKIMEAGRHLRSRDAADEDRFIDDFSGDIDRDNLDLDPEEIAAMEAEEAGREEARRFIAEAARMREEQEMRAIEAKEKAREEAKRILADAARRRAEAEVERLKAEVEQRRIAIERAQRMKDEIAGRYDQNRERIRIQEEARLKADEEARQRMEERERMRARPGAGMVEGAKNAANEFTRLEESVDFEAEENDASFEEEMTEAEAREMAEAEARRFLAEKAMARAKAHAEKMEAEAEERRVALEAAIRFKEEKAKRAEEEAAMLWMNEETRLAAAEEAKRRVEDRARALYEAETENINYRPGDDKNFEREESKKTDWRRDMDDYVKIIG